MSKSQFSAVHTSRSFRSSATPIVRSASAPASIGNWPDPMTARIGWWPNTMKASIGNWPDPMTARIGWWPNTMKASIGNWPDPMSRTGSARR